MKKIKFNFKFFIYTINLRYKTMIKSYKQYNKQENKKTLTNYNKVTKIVDYYLKYKLDTNIVLYYKIYNKLYNNTDIDIDHYKINLLIVYSFLKLTNGSVNNLTIIKKEIMNIGVSDLLISSYKILKNIYRILLITLKVEKNIIILFENRNILTIIKDYIDMVQIDMYDFNTLHDNNYIKIVKFINNRLTY